FVMRGNEEEAGREWEWLRRLPRAAPRKYPAPAWDGQPMPNGTVLLHTEQGLGDTLHFVRFARLVRQCVGRVIVECQPALVPLLRSCPDIDTVVGRGEPLPLFDAYAPLMSVPTLLALSADEIPATVPYISADAALVEQWRSRLANLSRLRVGIAWQANPKHKRDRSRSVALSAFAPLATISGVRLLCLQKDNTAR